MSGLSSLSAPGISLFLEDLLDIGGQIVTQGRMVRGALT